MIWLSVVTNGQTPAGKISGTIQDDKGHPVEAATVALLAAKDSAQVKTGVTDASGKFGFQNISSGIYLVQVTHIGHGEYISAPIEMTGTKTISLPPVRLSSTEKNLSSVTVTAQKSYVQQKIDRTVVNVNALASNTGSNALEVLSRTPGVQIDADGNITFKGKSGVMVMIDDKPTYLSSANLVTYLRSLPASSLDVIELMDNPPAKYDAAGNAGVINIKTKKNTTRGFNAVIAGDFQQGFYSRTNESLNLNYRVDKVNFFANLAYGGDRTYRRLEIDRNYQDGDKKTLSSLKDISYFRPREYNTNIKAGVDFFASEKTTWGVVYTGNISKSRDNSPVYSLLYGAAGELDSTINTNNSSDNKFNSNGLNLNYTHKFDKSGRQLTFDLDYIHDVANSHQLFVNNTIQPDGSLSNSTTLTDNLPSYIDIYSAKTDYSHPLGTKTKVEAGLKSSYVKTDNAANYFNVVDGNEYVDYNNSNRFLYNENINAAYLNYNTGFGRFSLQTGLRAENTNGSGHQLGNAQRPDSAFVKHYTNLFPTAYLSYNLDTAGHSVLVASYGRRVGRPNYGSLNPFTFFVDNYTRFSGNPFLRPQFTDNYKLAYNFKSLITLAVQYSLTTDVQNETIHRDSNVLISTTGNIGRQKTWNISATSNLQPAKWWTVNLYAEVYQNTYQGDFYTGYLNQSKVTFGANGSNQFTFSKGWSGELSGFFETGATYGQFVLLPKGMLNAALQKKILDNKGTIKLSVRDMLHSFSPSGTITNIQGVSATFHNTVDTRVIIIGFTYNLGKLTNAPQKRDAGGADSEQSRAH